MVVPTAQEKKHRAQRGTRNWWYLLRTKGTTGSIEHRGAPEAGGTCRARKKAQSTEGRQKLVVPAASDTQKAT